MSKRSNESEFDRYIATTFPHAQLGTAPIDFGDIHLRFELGGDHTNGTDERVTQATDRAAELFLACNSADDDLVLIITDWDSPGDKRLSTASPNYLYSLLSGFHNSHRFTKMVATETGSYPQLLFPTSLGKIEYRKILQGIAHLEQGRIPKIHASIYFLNQTRNLVFWMYGDRGCVIYADSRATIQSLYEQRNDWLVDYHRDHFDAIFGVTRDPS